MKRQAISINLGMLEKLQKEIEKEIKETKKIVPVKKSMEKKLGFQFSIVNYPTKQGKRTIYCSDTWQFEFPK